MVTYKEQKQNKKHFEILKGNITIGVFTSFKKLCESTKEKDNSFPSYWTLVKLDRTKPINVKNYTIQEIKLNQIKSEENGKL